MLGTNEPKVLVAKAGEDIQTTSRQNLALDSRLVIPKIYKSFRRTTDGSTAHGLTYPPQFLTMREITTSPQVYAHATDGGWTVDGVSNLSSADDTNVNIVKYSGDVGMWCMVLLDPCEQPTTDPLPTEIDGPRLIVSESVKTDPDYKHRLDSKYDTLKVARTGTLTLNVPSVNLSNMQEDTRTGSFTHGLGYIPFYAPFLPYLSYVDEFYLLNEGAADIPTTVLLNDLEAIEIPKGIAGYEYPYAEWAYIWVDDDKLNLKYFRVNFDFSAYTFPARTINLNYTIFYNRIDEEFNLL